MLSLLLALLMVSVIFFSSLGGVSLDFPLWEFDEHVQYHLSIVSPIHDNQDVPFVTSSFLIPETHVDILIW